MKRKRLLRVHFLATAVTVLCLPGLVEGEKSRAANFALWMTDRNFWTVVVAKAWEAAHQKPKLSPKSMYTGTWKAWQRLKMMIWIMCKLSWNAAATQRKVWKLTKVFTTTIRTNPQSPKLRSWRRRDTTFRLQVVQRRQPSTGCSRKTSKLCSNSKIELIVCKKPPLSSLAPTTTFTTQSARCTWPGLLVASCDHHSFLASRSHPT